MNQIDYPADVSLTEYTITPLKTEVLDKFYYGRQVYKTLEPFIYDNSSPGICLRIIVPAGFETDFASIPRIFWVILPPFGQYTKAAVVHDFMYKEKDSPRREICDAVLLEIMAELNTPWYRKWPIYFAVRCFGWMFFTSNKNKE